MKNEFKQVKEEIDDDELEEDEDEEVEDETGFYDDENDDDLAMNYDSDDSAYDFLDYN